MKTAMNFCLCAALNCAVVSAQETQNAQPVLLVEESQESQPAEALLLVEESQESQVVEEGEALEMSSYSGEQITGLIPLLEEWVGREFANYPYLWVPTQGEICETNARLPSEENALVTVVRKEGVVVGVAAGIAFDSAHSKEGREVLDKVIAQGFDPSKMVYMCYFLTAPECRNDAKLVEMIYNNY